MILRTSHIGLLVPGDEAREPVDTFLARAEREACGMARLEPAVRLRCRGAGKRGPRGVGASNDRARVPERAVVLAHDAHGPAARHRPHQEARVAVEVEAAVLAVVGGDQRDRDPVPVGVDGEELVGGGGAFAARARATTTAPNTASASQRSIGLASRS